MPTPKIQAILEKHNITAEQYNALRRALDRCWGDIGMDIEAELGGHRQAMKTYGSEDAMIVSTCIDGYRLLDYGDLAWVYTDGQGNRRDNVEELCMDVLKRGYV